MENVNDQTPEQIYQSPDRLAETPPPTYEESQESRDQWTVNIPSNHHPEQPPPQYNEGELVSKDASRAREKLTVDLLQNQHPAYRSPVVSLLKRFIWTKYKKNFIGDS